jgi:hypothetical protein
MRTGDRSVDVYVRKLRVKLEAALPDWFFIHTRRGPTAYPIVSQTFLDVYQDPCKAGGASSATARGLKRFLTYAIGAGQQTLGSGGK